MEMLAAKSNCVARWLFSPAAALTFTSYTPLPLPLNYGDKLAGTVSIFMKPKAKASSDVREKMKRSSKQKAPSNLRRPSPSVRVGAASEKGNEK